MLSIASAGDNALAMLTRDPREVVAVDYSPAQLAAVELRLAAYRELDHASLLRLLGARPGEDRAALYRACRGRLSADARSFWDARPDAVAGGVALAGKFERYFRLFRTYALPLVHGRRTRAALFEPRDAAGRRAFYDDTWNTRRWRLLFKLYFGRRLLGRLGRDATFFRHVEPGADVSGGIRDRAEHALATLDPSANPYLRAIVTGGFADDLPLAWRAEHFDVIRDRVDRVTLVRGGIGEVQGPVDRWNLSDLFEYLSPSDYADLLKRLADRTTPGGRLVYWNMAADRQRPAALADVLRPLDDLAAELHAADKAFFYKRLVIEERA